MWTTIKNLLIKHNLSTISKIKKIDLHIKNYVEKLCGKLIINRDKQVFFRFVYPQIKPFCLFSI